MAVNSLIELAPHDPTVEARLGAHFAMMRGALTAAIDRAQQAGAVRGDRPADDLARYLETVVSGLATAGRGGAANAAPSLIEIALDALRAP